MIKKLLTAALALFIATSPAFAASYSVDNNGDDSNPGTPELPLKNMHACVAKSSREVGGTWCVGTQGQTFYDFVGIFWSSAGGGTVQFGSSGPLPINLQPLNGSYFAEIGDGALVGFQAAHFSLKPGTNAIAYIHGHNFGVVDLNVQISADLGAVTSVVDCDFDTHINVNNGITLNGVAGQAAGFVYKPCMGSTFDINGAETHTGPAATQRWAWNQPGSKMEIEGNVSFVNPLTTSPALVNTSALLLNVSGYSIPGGVPVGGGTYCTSQSYC